MQYLTPKVSWKLSHVYIWLYFVSFSHLLAQSWDDEFWDGGTFMRFKLQVKVIRDDLGWSNDFNLHLLYNIGLLIYSN